VKCGEEILEQMFPVLDLAHIRLGEESNALQIGLEVPSCIFLPIQGASFSSRKLPASTHWDACGNHYRTHSNTGQANLPNSQAGREKLLQPMQEDRPWKSIHRDFHPVPAAREHFPRTEEKASEDPVKEALA
jgi:hypothetical protein